MKEYIPYPQPIVIERPYWRTYPHWEYRPSEIWCSTGAMGCAGAGVNTGGPLAMTIT